MSAGLLAPFRVEGRIHRPLLAVFLAINTIVAVNAVAHEPGIGYDAEHHLAYLEVMASGTLPSPEQSGEFYAAPLPYAIPAALAVVGINDPPTLARAAMLMNLACSILLTYFLIRLTRIGDRDPSLALWTLVLLGTLAVYYRTMAFVRGEALCAMLAVVVCERVLTLARQREISTTSFAGVGVLIGLMMLAKQWGIFVAAAVCMFFLLRAWQRAEAWRTTAAGLLAMTLTALLVGGWFYAYLSIRYGSPVVAAYEPPPFSLTRRPLAFYTTLGLGHLFVDPVREVYSNPDNLLLPILYSDSWGDYWCYWLQPWDAAIEFGTYSGQPLLARANIAGVVPTLLYAGGLVAGAWLVVGMLRRRPPSAIEDCLVLCVLVSGVTLAGFIGLLIWHPALDVKATYVLQAFPFGAVLGAAFLSEINRRNRRLGGGLQWLAIVAFLMNLPALFTRFGMIGNPPQWLWPTG